MISETANHVWIVGQWKEGEDWQFVGVYDSPGNAISACVTDLHFWARVTINKSAPVETVNWDESWGAAWGGYPLREA